MPRYSLLQGNLTIEPDQSAKEIRVFGVKRLPKLKEVSLADKTTISFTRNAAAADTINDSGDAMVSTGFVAGDMVKVEGGTNDGLEALVASVAVGALTLHSREFVTTEAAGTSITLTTVSHVDEEYQDVLISLAARNLAKKYGVGDLAKLDSIYRMDRAALTGSSEMIQDDVRLPYVDF